MIFFFIFLKLFLRSTYQIDPKYIKKINFQQKKLNFYGTLFAPRFQTVSKLYSKLYFQKMSYSVIFDEFENIFNIWSGYKKNKVENKIF